jgi:hypothetical protein
LVRHVDPAGRRHGLATTMSDDLETAGRLLLKGWNGATTG